MSCVWIKGCSYTSREEASYLPRCKDRIVKEQRQCLWRPRIEQCDCNGGSCTHTDGEMRGGSIRRKPAVVHSACQAWTAHMHTQNLPCHQIRTLAWCQDISICCEMTACIRLPKQPLIQCCVRWTHPRRMKPQHHGEHPCHLESPWQLTRSLQAPPQAQAGQLLLLHSEMFSSLTACT